MWVGSPEPTRREAPKRNLRLILVVFHFQVAVSLPWLFMLWPYGSGEPAPHETKQIICGINRDAGTPRLCEAAI